MAEHLRFSPAILQRLGEELTPHIDQGIVELVRNAYDADATTCRVELIDTDRPGGTVRITDDGDGMTISGIRSGWLLLGRSEKRSRIRTPKGRRQVGEKGLGRLAALRMGAAVTLSTRPRDEPGTEHRIELDWSRFDRAETVESVALNIETRRASTKAGTSIEIRDVRRPLIRRDVQRLARSLLLLADPFKGTLGFRPELVGSDFEDLERRVKDAYFKEADYKLVAQVDSEGHARAQVSDRNGRMLWSIRNLAGAPYGSPPVVFELWNFLLDAEKFRRRGATAAEVKDWLAVVGGVHLYHRDLRVYPYGDPGYDWLDMNLERVRNPEERPSTNNSLGRVVVEDPEDQLRPKTDRSGFIENDAFLELRRFATDSLEWMARERLRERERRRKHVKGTAAKSVATARVTLKDAIKAVPARSRPDVERAVRRLERAHEVESRALREDVQLYRTLGTVGTTTAVFAHEAAKPATQIEQMAKVVETRGRSLLPNDYANSLEEPVNLILGSARTLRTFSALPVQLLEHEKRQSTLVLLHKAVSEVCKLFMPFLSDGKIHIEFVPVPDVVWIRGSIAAIEAVVSNLIINAVNAFNRKDAPSRPRELRIWTELSSDRVLLHVADSGPGVVGISLDDIWLPGRTTMTGGTGLGLTIVRDAVEDLGGETHALSRGDLGGAEFIVELPVAEVGVQRS